METLERGTHLRIEAGLTAERGRREILERDLAQLKQHVEERLGR